MSSMSTSWRKKRTPLGIISSSQGLSFVVLVALMQNAGLSVVVPSLALHLKSLGSSRSALGYVAAMAPFVSVVSPTLTGYVTDYLTRSNRTRTPYAAVYFVSLVFFVA